MSQEMTMQGIYHFKMIWHFDVPISTAWEMLNQAQEWPRWWKNCRNVEQLRPGDAHGVGAVQRFTMQTQLPYQLQFEIRSTRAEPPRLLEGQVEGNLEGHVRWELAQEGPLTKVNCYWDVRPTKPWMRTVSPVLRPLFVWNHRAMMHNGGQGLARMMDAHLTDEKYF
jgi:hypothetical protein